MRLAESIARFENHRRKANELREQDISNYLVFTTLRTATDIHSCAVPHAASHGNSTDSRLCLENPSDGAS
ncbi:MAG: hypothetical protein NZ749_06820 [bacterium]|nr:hypothetical protein [bacterium]